jgi:hypothetical protein
MGSIQINVYFTGEFLSNFTLKNMISTHTKAFSIEKMAQSCQITKFL